MFLGVVPYAFNMYKDGGGAGTFVTNIKVGNGHTKIIYTVSGMETASDIGACTNIGVLRMLNYGIVENTIIYKQNDGNVSFSLTDDKHLQITSGYPYLSIKMYYI